MVIEEWCAALIAFIVISIYWIFRSFSTISISRNSTLLFNRNFVWVYVLVAPRSNSRIKKSYSYNAIFFSLVNFYEKIIFYLDWRERGQLIRIIFLTHTLSLLSTFDVVILRNKFFYFIVWMLFNQMLIFITLTAAIDVNEDDVNDDAVTHILPLMLSPSFSILSCSIHAIFNQKTETKQYQKQQQQQQHLREKANKNKITKNSLKSTNFHFTPLNMQYGIQLNMDWHKPEKEREGSRDKESNVHVHFDTQQ